MLLEAAVARAHEEQLYAGAIRAQNNLGVSHQSADRYADALELIERSLALARRRGDRRWESNMRTGDIEILFMLGRWDEALAVTADEEPLAQSMPPGLRSSSAALVHSERGDATTARALLAANDVVRDERPACGHRQPTTLSTRASCAPRDRPVEALAAAERVLDLRPELAVDDISFKRAWVEGVEAALELSDAEKAEELLQHRRVPRPGRAHAVPPGECAPPPCSSGVGARRSGRHRRAFRQRRRPLPRVRHGLLARRHGARARRVACWSGPSGRAEPLLAEAREIFEQLEAAPWLERTGCSGGEAVTA